MVDSSIRVTSDLLWRATALFACMVAALLPLLARAVPRERFERLARPLVGATFIVWSFIWMMMAIVYWEPVYSFFFPAWSRWVLPFFMGTGFAAASRGIWSVARHAVHRPVVAFVLLGGCLGPLTHGWAVLRGLVTKPPMLQEASPLAAMAIAAPEFALYFSAIVGLALLLESASGRRAARR